MPSEETRRKLLILAGISCLLGLVLLDETAIGVLLPTVQKELGFSEVFGHWFVNVYLLSLACFVALSGKLADTFGILRVFLIGLLVFACGSLVVAVSSSGDLAIAGRALQGIGAAICFPLFVAIITITFPKGQRGRALGICATVGTVFMAAGPLIGGFLTEYFSWRAIFFINPPLSLIIAIIAVCNFRDVPRPSRQPVDWLGFVLLCYGLSSLVFALMQSSSMGWGNPLIIFMFGLGLLMLVSFFLVEITVDQPFIMMSLFKNKIFAAGNMNMFVAQFAKIPIFVFSALYAQYQLKMSPLAAGSIVMLAVLLQPIAAPICGRLTDRGSANKLVCFGQISLFVSLLWLFLVSPLQNWVAMIPGLLLSGIAFPFLFIPSQVALMAQLPESMHGQGSGISISSQMIGGTLGLAACSALFDGVDGYQNVYGVAALGVALVFCINLFLNSKQLSTGANA